jgi:hypothetical protein
MARAPDSLRKVNQQRLIAASNLFNKIDPVRTFNIGPMNERKARKADFG